MSQIPFDKREGKIWYNGEVVEWKDATIHVLTHGLHYGSTVYEGVRIYNYKPFKLREHMSRLHHSAQCLGFEVPFSVDELCESMIQQIKVNNVENGYGRPAAWRGSESMLIGGEGTKINVVIAVWNSFENKRHAHRQEGINLGISKWRKPNADASPYSAKAASIYTLCTIVKNQAVVDGFDDAIMLDSKGNITEATTSNIFFIKNGELHTPIPDCFLNGLTRQTYISIAKANEIKVHERYIKKEEISDFDGAFLTGTAIEMMPIKRIGQVEFSKSNAIMDYLSNEYSKLVNS